MTTMNIRRAVDINGAVQLMQAVGREVTLVLLSEPGVGKTSTLRQRAIANGDKWRKVGDHYPEDKYEYCYIDSPNKRDGDLFMLMPERDTRTIEQYTTGVINLNDPRPKIILLDEVFKTLKSMKPLFTRLILERCLGDRPLPPGSEVFATSNNVEDGVGDSFAGHEADRVWFIPMSKPKAEVWASGWAAENGVSPITRACVYMNPRVMASYMDGVTTADNPIIFHPKTNPTRYASPRSIASADVAVRNRHVLGEELTWVGVEGATNAAYAQLLMAFIAMEKDMIDPRKILANPTGTPLPENTSALVLLMYNLGDVIETQDDMSNAIDYVMRHDSREMQALFASILSDNSRTAKLGATNRKIQEWVVKNYRIVR